MVHSSPVPFWAAWLLLALVSVSGAAHDHEHEGEEPELGTVRLGVYLPNTDNLIAYHSEENQWDGGRLRCAGCSHFEALGATC
jgi:hypothetical protein